MANVADEATKWQKTPEFNEASRWFSGPEFLLQKEDNWPKISTDIPKATEEEQPCSAEPKRFSSWQRLLNAQVRFQQCCRLIIGKLRRSDELVGPEESIELDQELDQAEKQLFRRAQFECYADEIITLRKAPPSNMLTKSSSIFKYSPYLDSDGLLRIDAAENVDESLKRPIILPSKHEVTSLIVEHHHRKFLHENHETTINELRQKYAIPHKRQVVKSIKSRCQKCRNIRALPQLPEMGNLPAARLAAFTAPFTFVGIDFFTVIGPPF